MTWFYDNFLPSLFERVGINNAMWITKKQTAVCCQYMQQENRTYENKYGERYKALTYTTLWNGRKVWLYYSKLNGCGQIYFDYNDFEKAELQVQQNADEERRQLERIKRMLTNRPEKYQAKIEEIKAQITEEEEEYQEDIADYGVDSEWVKRDIEFIAELKEKLALWESVRDS